MVDVRENLKGKIDDGADKANTWTQEVTDRARATAGGMVETVKEQVQAVATGASEMAGKAKDTAQEWASSVRGAAVQAKDKARDVASAAAEKASEAGQDLTALIRRYPLQSLLAGFGVGLLVAFVLRRS